MTERVAGVAPGQPDQLVSDGAEASTSSSGTTPRTIAKPSRRYVSGGWRSAQSLGQNVHGNRGAKGDGILEDAGTVNQREGEQWR